MDTIFCVFKIPECNPEATAQRRNLENTTYWELLS